MRPAGEPIRRVRIVEFQAIVASRPAAASMVLAGSWISEGVAPLAMSDMSNLLQQAQKMQREMRQVQEDLKKRTVMGDAGGGMVKVYVNGAQDVLRIEVDPEVVDPEDVGMLEDLLLVAVRNGIEKAKDLSKTEMSRVTGGLPMPGMF